MPLTTALLAAATSTWAQPGPSDAQASMGIECGGQYECVPYIALTEAEARKCLGYPRPARTEPRYVDAQAAKDSCNGCEGARSQ